MAAEHQSMPTTAYFMTEFPRATDTFVQREIAALRRLGLPVESFALRRPSDEIMVGPEQRTHRAQTTYLLEGGIAGLLLATIGAIGRPSRLRTALRVSADLAQPGLRGRKYQAFYFAEALLLARALRRRRIEHLHCHYGDVSSTIGMIAARLADTRCSVTVHGPGVFFVSDQWHLGYKARHADFIACISWFCRSQLLLLAGEPVEHKLHIIHCGVDPQRYLSAARNAPIHDPDDHNPDAGLRGAEAAARSADAAARSADAAARSADPAPVASTAEADGTEGEAGAGPVLKIGVVGRLERVKGIDILLRSHATLRARGHRIRTVIVGDGPDRAAFAALAADLGIDDEIDFRGNLSQDDVAHVLADLDVFVLPSFAEGVPVVLMEAMASGVPVVATQVGGVSELVADQRNGFVIRPSDHEALTDALDTLLSDAGLRAEMGRSGREIVRRDFDSDTEAARILRLFIDHQRGMMSAIRPEPIETTTRPAASLR